MVQAELRELTRLPIVVNIGDHPGQLPVGKVNLMKERRKIFRRGVKERDQDCDVQSRVRGPRCTFDCGSGDLFVVARVLRMGTGNGSLTGA